MARIPTADDFPDVGLSQTRPDDTVSEKQSAVLTGPDQALQHLGKGIEQVAVKVAGIANEKDPEEDYELKKKMIEFERENDRRYMEYQRNMPAGGAGFSEGWNEQYREHAKQEWGPGFRYMTPAQQKMVNLSLIKREEATSNRAYGDQIREEDRYIADDLKQQVGKIYEDVGALDPGNGPLLNQVSDLRGKGLSLINSAKIQPSQRFRLAADFNATLNKTVFDSQLNSAFSKEDFAGLQKTLFDSAPIDNNKAQKDRSGREFLGTPGNPPATWTGPRNKFDPATERAIEEAATRNGVDVGLARTFADIESGGKAGLTTGSYSGLFQLSPAEFNKYGGGDIANPTDNANAAMAKLKDEYDTFQQRNGRAPTPTDLYMVHQQGASGYAAHMANPDGTAWENIRPYYTDAAAQAKGFKNGDDYAKAAIWGNIANADKKRFGSVDNVTSGQLINYWADKVNRRLGAGAQADVDTKQEYMLPGGSDKFGPAVPIGKGTGNLAAVTTSPVRTVDPDTGFGNPLTGKVTVNGHSYDFVSGGKGRGSIPMGTYSIGRHWTAQERAASGYELHMDSFDLNNVRDTAPGTQNRPAREGLLIHDSASGKTAGCIGIQGNYEAFKKDLEAEQKASGTNGTITIGPKSSISSGAKLAGRDADQSLGQAPGSDDIAGVGGRESAADAARAAPGPDPIGQAMRQYPILGKAGVVGKYTEPKGGDKRMLESWAAGEPGDKETPRPNELPADKHGIEVFDRAGPRPIDVLGDYVSHQGVKTDPKLKKYYEDFVGSITPEQEAKLRDQYKYAQDNEGEKRTYEQWKEVTGLPAYFRGYAFKQWPENVYDKAYTPDQRSKLDEMMGYLSEGGPSKVGATNSVATAVKDEAEGKKRYVGPFADIEGVPGSGFSLKQRVDLWKKVEQKQQQIGTGILGEIKELEKGAIEGVLPTDAAMAQLQEKVEAYGDPRVTAQLEDTVALARTARVLRTLPPDQLDGYLAERRAQLLKTGGSARSVELLDKFETMAGKMKSTLGTDMLGWNRKATGQSNGQVDFFGPNVTEQSLNLQLSQRAAFANQVAAKYGREPQYWTEDDRKRLSTVMAQGGEPMLRIVGAITRGMGSDAQDALKELAPKMPEAPYLGSLMNGADKTGGEASPLQTTIADAAQGIRLREDPNHQKLLNSGNAEYKAKVQEVAGSTFTGAEKNSAGAIKMADAIYEARVFKQGGVKGVDFQADVWEQAYKDALGQSTYRNQTYGGPMVYDNRGWGSDWKMGSAKPRIVVPPNIQANRFRDVINAIRPEDIFTKFSSAEMEAVASGPMARQPVVDAKGRLSYQMVPVPMADFRIANLQSVGPGQYHMFRGDPNSADPQPYLDSKGKAYVLDLNALEPKLRRRPGIAGAYMGQDEPVADRRTQEGYEAPANSMNWRPSSTYR